MRVCITCGAKKELNSTNFYWRADAEDWRTTCKECWKKKTRKRYAENTEEILKKDALYRERNKEHRRSQQRIYNSNPTKKALRAKWRQDNKKYCREKERLWIKKNPEKYKIIARRKGKIQRQRVSIRIKVALSKRISEALKRAGSSKQGKSILDFLPYSIQELKGHLEKQFEPWMNWSNRGKYNVDTWDDNDISTWTWQIDHIVPHSTFNYSSMEDDAFQKCWALENLRPYPAKLNVLEGSSKVRHK